MRGKRLISCCIPTYKEHDYIVESIRNISQQTMFPDMEIVIADYDPDNTKETYNAVFSKKQLPDDVLERIEWVKVPKKGIGIARRMAVEAATSPFIVTFDADSKFSSNDAIEVLTHPLLTGECSFTHCACTIDINDKPHPVPNFLYALRDVLLSPIGIPIEQGLCFSKVAYDKVGGWDDVTVGEGPLLALKVMAQLGIEAIKHIDSVFVIVSGRRTGGGAFFDLDYGKAYRGNVVHEIK